MMTFIDPPTMFLALVASTVAATLLLFWAYFLNRSERSLLWMALGFLLVAASNVLLATRGVIPQALAIYGTGAFLTLGTAMAWVAARTFNGRSVHSWVPLIGPCLWLAACQLPAFYDSFAARGVVGSLIPAAFFFAAAREFFVRDGLRTRYALAAALALHGTIVLMRAPMIALTVPVAGDVFANPWFGPVALEGAIFLQVVAFLMVSLAKERVEMGLRVAALTDPLTGLGNRRAFFETSEPIVADGARSGRPAATIVFDLDRFKDVNDRHGHPVGDAVLQTFAATTKRFLRPGDFAGRLGGEEFAVTLADTSGENARLVAERITRAFEEAVATLSDQAFHCTASAGVAAGWSADHSLDQLLLAADRALYEAKGLGGNQVRQGKLPGPVADRAA